MVPLTCRYSATELDYEVLLLRVKLSKVFYTVTARFPGILIHPIANINNNKKVASFLAPTYMIMTESWKYLRALMLRKGKVTYISVR